MTYGPYVPSTNIRPYEPGASALTPDFDWKSMYGPVSKSLNAASGIFDAAATFSAGRNLKASASQFKLMARQAMAQGIETGRDITHEGAEAVGSMTAAFGKSGTLLEGSPLLALADTGREIETNISRAIEQGRIQYQAYMWQAKQAEKAAKGFDVAGIAKLAGTAAMALL